MENTAICIMKSCMRMKRRSCPAAAGKEINDLLYPMSIARTMGGAIGMYYSYIDLAVFDRDGFAIALEKINEKDEV